MAKLTNPHNRYDKESGLWIQARKRVYLYWFRFLQEAEASGDYQVDWAIYDQWGGRDAIFPPSKGDFDAWWTANWRVLFGMPTPDGEPRFPLSTRKVRADNYRVALLVHQVTRLNPNSSRIDIADELRKLLGGQDAPFMLNLTMLREADGSNFEYIERSVSRYRKYARNHLTSVCIGKFP